MTVPEASPRVLPLHISTYSRYSVGFRNAMFISTPALSNNTWIANLAIYLPYFLPFPYPVRRMWWFNGSTVTGNVSIGVYTYGGGKIYASASTAQSGGSSIQYVTPGSDILLPPGRGYFAISCSGTTNAFQTSGPGSGGQMRLLGALQESAAVPLPATLTPVAWAQGANVGVPLFGITRTASGF